MSHWSWIDLSFYALLTCAMLTDLLWRRIPNVLVLAAILGVLAFRAGSAGVYGLLEGCEGAGVALLMFLPLYLLKTMGAGDVKLMVAVGVFLGPKLTLLATGLTLLAGFFIALGILIGKRGVKVWLRRWGSNLLTLTMAHGAQAWCGPAAGEAAAVRFPYAIAIAAGSILAVYLPHGFL